MNATVSVKESKSPTSGKKSRKRKLSPNNADSDDGVFAAKKNTNNIASSPERKCIKTELKLEDQEQSAIHLLSEMKLQRDEEDAMLFDKMMADKLSSIKIVPPEGECISRSYETRICKLPSKDVIMKIKSSGQLMKMGKFNTREDNIIRKNWENFSRIYEIEDPSVFCNTQYWCLMPYEEKRNFVIFLANGLPKRYLCSIYGRYSALYQNLKNGKFDKWEDELIKAEISSNSPKYFSNLSKLLNRSRLSIYRRARLMQTGETVTRHERTEGKWSMDEIKRMLLSILKVTGCQKLKELRSTCLKMKVWLLVSKDCGIPHDSLRHLWEQRLSTQLLAKKPIYKTKICIKVLDILSEEKAKHWQDVHWNRLAEEFNGVSGLFLFNCFKTLVRKQVLENRDSLHKCIQHLNQHWKPTITNMKDKEYPRLKLKNGELVSYFTNVAKADCGVTLVPD